MSPPFLFGISSHSNVNSLHTRLYLYTYTSTLHPHASFYPFKISFASVSIPLSSLHNNRSLSSTTPQDPVRRKMKAVQAVPLFLTTLAITVFRTRPPTANAYPFNPNKIFGDYVVSFRENVEHMVDVGACSRAALSGIQPATIPFMPVYSQLHWHAINVRLDDFAVDRKDVCNKCVILRSAETNKNIIAVVAGDCSKCVEGEINLTPAAYAAVNEGVTLDGITAPGGFLNVVECPKNNEEILKYAYDYNIPAMTFKDVLNYG